MLNRRRIPFILRLNLILAVVVGGMVLRAYLREPSEPSSAVFLGFSFLRLILILFVIALLVAFVLLSLSSLRSSWQAQTNGGTLLRLATQKGILWIPFLGIAITYLVLSFSEQQLGALASYRERLFPVLIWLGVLSAQSAFVLLYLRGVEPKIFQSYRGLLVPTFLVLTLFGALLLIIHRSRIGLTPDDVYWQGAGAPILLYQVFLAIGAAVLFYWLIEHTHLGRSNKLDLMVFLGLWVFAGLLWLSQPAKPTYFSLEPRAPNFQSYPFSDALIYDSTAQEFLIGKAMPADFWVKPVYSFFLAVLHLFAGENYALLTSLQVIILAIIPSFVYLLTSYLDKRLSGLLAAFFVMIREHNALALSDVIQLSHSKLLLSDVFAMGEMILLVWLIVWWLGHPLERRAAPVAVGGVLGLLILTRGHPILMIPFVFLVSFIVLKSDLKLWYASSLRLLLGLALVLVLWFLHTYQLTGKLTFQDPASPYAVNDTLVKLYTNSSNASTEADSAQSPSYGKFQSLAFRSVLEHPVEIAYFTSAHYVHNVIFSYLYLPMSFQIEDLKTYVKRLPFWERSWDGSMSLESEMMLLLNLTVLSVGIAAAWKKTNRLMFAPLILGAAYNLSIAVARRSGWRFILPADWVTLVFYAIGFIQLMMILQSVANQQLAQTEDPEPHLRPSPGPSAPQLSALAFGLPFLLVAVGLVAGHRLFPLLYPAKSSQQLLQDYQNVSQIGSETEITALKNFLEKDGATILYGKALYPTYFKPNDGMSNFNWPSFSLQPYGRLAFYLIGPESVSVNLPMESPPPHLADGASVIVVGCRSGTSDIKAVSVLIRDDPPLLFTSGPLSTANCPFSAPD